jgi:site-specific DNA recombinase
MPESAIAYVRVSDPNDEGSGLALQRDRVLAYAADRGYFIVDIIEDKQSGVLYRERTGLQAAIAALKAKRATVLLIDRLDRISRRQAHVYIIDEACRDAGGRLEAVQDQFEDSPEGRLLFSVKAFIAEIDRERILMRTVAGRKARVEKKLQLIPGIRPLYGYVWRDGTKGAYDIDPITAPIVKRIFAAARAGQSFLSIAGDLTADGIPTPTGQSRWTQSSVGYILKHPHYCGDAWAWAWRPQDGYGKKNARFDPEGGFLLPDGTVPAIVTRDEWEAAQRVIASNRNRKARDGTHAEAALMRGRVVCAHCGHGLYVSPRRGKLVYRCESRYRYETDCTVHSIDVAELDMRAWAFATGIIDKPQAFMRGREAASRVPDRSREVKSIQAAITRLERQQSTLTRRIAGEEDDLVVTPMMAELRAVSGRLHAAHEQLTALTDAVASGAMQSQAITDFVAWCQGIARELPSMSFAGRRSVIEILGVTATVARRNVTPQATFVARPMA